MPGLGHVLLTVGRYELCSDMIDVVLDVSAIYGQETAAAAVAAAADGGAALPAYDPQARAVIRLNNGFVLYLRGNHSILRGTQAHGRVEVNQCLALVALLREESLEKQGLIDYNFRVFRQVSCSWPGALAALTRS